MCVLITMVVTALMVGVAITLFVASGDISRYEDETLRLKGEEDE